MLLSSDIRYSIYCPYQMKPYMISLSKIQQSLSTNSVIAQFTWHGDANFDKIYATFADNLKISQSSRSHDNNTIQMLEIFLCFNHNLYEAFIGHISLLQIKTYLSFDWIFIHCLDRRSQLFLQCQTIQKSLTKLIRENSALRKSQLSSSFQLQNQKWNFKATANLITHHKIISETVVTFS